MSPSSVLEAPGMVVERERWTSDPRPDIADGTTAWSLLLGIAFDADGAEPNGCFGVLHGLRCCGAGLERDERGRWKVTAGEMDATEYAADRDAWLMPRRTAVGELLRRLEVQT